MRTRTATIALALLLVAGCADKAPAPAAAVESAAREAALIAGEGVEVLEESAQDVAIASTDTVLPVVLALREAAEVITEPLPAPQDDLQTAMEIAATDPGALVIAKYETVSDAYYERHLKAVYCPKGNTASGPTGGVGYDFAHQTPAEIRRVWGWHPQVDVLVTASGQGGPAKCAAWRKKHGRILVELDDAKRVFAIDSFPKYRRMAIRALPGLDGKTVGHIGGVTSTGYRRGWSMTGSRMRHKRVIRDECMPIKGQRESADCSATQTIAMCVIWEGTDQYKGQCRRSHDEAAVIRS